MLRRAKKGNKTSLAAIRAKADQYAENLRPELEALGKKGVTSLGTIADALNEQETLTTA